MTHELMKSFTTWWSKSSIACDRGTDCRSAYEAGWEAHAAAPVVGSENSEIEFQKWWEHTPLPPLRHLIGECTAKEIWSAAYTAAQVAHTTGRTTSYALGKAEARNAIETQLLGMAGHAFIAGKDEHAHWFRSLVNVLFKSEDK